MQPTQLPASASALLIRVFEIRCAPRCGALGPQFPDAPTSYSTLPAIAFFLDHDRSHQWPTLIPFLHDSLANNSL